MKEVTCPNCGQKMPEGYARCTICGTAIDDLSQPVHTKAQQRFIVWFILLTIFFLFVAVILPR